MNELLTNIKREVKSHTIIPFTTRDITCRDNGLVIGDKYRAHNSKKILETIGIRDNLIKEIYSKPEENWSAIRDAINTIDPKKKFGGIVSSRNELMTLTKEVDEATELNFDDRLDRLFDTIDNSQEHALQSITFNPVDCNVNIGVVNESREIECGLGDNWKFGTTSIIGNTNQQFMNFFLRLVCTNGMTTRENIGYRNVTEKSNNIGKQFLKFANNDAFANSIIPRVNRLRNARASLYEFMSVADALKAEDRDEFMPEYGYVVESFENAGRPVDSFSAQRKKFVYTNENLYDVFNLATNLASHQREKIGIDASMKLNKVASDIFTKGPNLDFDIVDIWRN